jgi:hypothetical protein
MMERGLQGIQDELTLSKYTLEPEEAHRFRAILGEAVERLNLLGLVTADSSRRLATKREPTAQNNIRNRKDIVALMVKQKELERAFEHLMHKRWTLRGLSNKSKYLRNQAELKELAKLLSQSTANISQNLRDHPTIVGNLNKIQKDRSELETMLVETMTELHEFTFNTLVDQVAQRTEEQRRLYETKKKCDETAEALKLLEQKLESECERFDRESEERDQKIAKLTAHHKHLKKVTRLALDFEKETSLARAETRSRQRKRQLDELRRRIAKASEGIQRDAFVNEKSLGFLNNQHTTLENLGDEWEQRYKTDHEELSKKFDDLENERNDSKKKLTWHQNRWDKEQVRQKALEEEAKRRERQEVARKRLLWAMTYMQCRVRAYWKVYKKREHKSKKKGKKAKKTKKKNGKNNKKNSK